MAIGIHVAQIVMKPVTATGVVLDKETATMDEMMVASSEQRVLQDAAIASSTGYPNIKTYLEREALAGYVAEHINQTYIVTYSAADINNA